MEFQNLEELKELFLEGIFNFPPEIIVSGIKYKTNKTPNVSMQDIIQKGYKPMWTYVTAFKEQARQAKLDHVIVFLWGYLPDRNMIVPYAVRASSKARLAAPVVEKVDNGDSINISKEKIIGDIADVIITSIPGSKPIKGKIDTGADVSSLHAENWKIDNGQVTFVCNELSENQITMPVIEKQAVKLSNGDMEYRPVIELNIKINDQQLTNVMFNLNDRGAMTYPMLIGQNVLECGGFMIDPTIDIVESEEEFEADWEALQEEYKDEDVDDFIADINKEKLNKLLDFVDKEIK